MNPQRMLSLKHLYVIIFLPQMERPFVCEICSKTYSSKSSLIRHLGIHAGNKPHDCEECDNSFQYTYLLKQHTLAVHGNKKEHVCPTCGKRFAYRQTLHSHAVKHNPKNIYKCNVCDDRSYLTKAKLKRHMKTHDEPEKCERCSKEVHHMDLHRKICASGPRIREYQCTVCGRKFLQKRYLSEHKRCVHSFYEICQCDQCSRRFRHRSTLYCHRKYCSGHQT